MPQTISTEEALPQGLTTDEAARLAVEGKVNANANVKTRSIRDIARDNICTLFNLVNVILAVLVFLTGSYKNMLFMFIIILNVLIGIVQELRSKQLTDRLAIVVASQVDAVRSGALTQIPVDQIVLGDVIRLARGDQVPADACVVQGSCKANESLLTGESRLIPKGPGAHERFLRQFRRGVREGHPGGRGQLRRPHHR